jgi:putative chitobiose transport system permease protein
MPNNKDHLWLFSAPAVLVLVFFNIGPAIAAAILSFFNYSGVSTPRFNGVDNYLRLLKDTDFVHSLQVSGLFMVLVVPALVVLPIAMALLVEKQSKTSQYLRIIYYLPVIISMVVAGLMWKWLLAEKGLLNYLFNLHIPWLSLPDTALVAVSLVTIWKGLGYYMMIYLASLQSIPGDLKEAARLDGASESGIFYYLTLPFIRPTMLLVLLLSMSSALKTFTEMYVLTKGGPLGATTTSVYYLYQQGFERLDIGYANAIGVVIFIVMGLLSWAHRQLEKKYGT